MGRALIVGPAVLLEILSWNGPIRIPLEILTKNHTTTFAANPSPESNAVCGPNEGKKRRGANVRLIRFKYRR